VITKRKKRLNIPFEESGEETGKGNFFLVKCKITAVFLWKV
jgi:hypothetical protein